MKSIIVILALALIGTTTGGCATTISANIGQRPGAAPASIQDNRQAAPAGPVSQAIGSDESTPLSVVLIKMANGKVDMIVVSKDGVPHEMPMTKELVAALQKIVPKEHVAQIDSHEDIGTDDAPPPAAKKESEKINDCTKRDFSLYWQHETHCITINYRSTT